MGDDDRNRNEGNPWPPPNRPYQEKEEDTKLWGVFLFGLIGATVTTFAVSFVFFIRASKIIKLEISNMI